MSATTEANPRKNRHVGAPAHRHRSYSWLAIGGIVFVAAWLAWNFWLAALVAG